MFTKLHYTLTTSFVFYLVFIGRTTAQCPSCTATTFNVNLSSVTDSAWTTSCVRNGNCCTGTNCVRFNVTLNQNSDLLSFNVTNPSPSGSAYYQINCGPQIPIGNPICIVGMTSVCITYCKPGGDSPNYHITSSRSVRASNDISLRTGCSGTLNVVGLLPSTILWTSIYPGLPGAYNSYLSCTTGCSSTTVTPTSATPAYIDYMVSGSPASACAGTSRDTVRVYVFPVLLVNVSPANAILCSGGPSSATLTANVTGGAIPYTYLWSPGGQTTPSITVSAAGNYTVSVSDGTICPPVVAIVNVTSVTTPPVPATSSNSPVCAGSPINLSASNIPGASYSWTGPNGFSSAVQNPVIPIAAAANAGTYSVIATIATCVGQAGTTSVVVNPVPSPPVTGSNSPVCSTGTLNLTASTIAGAAYSWTGPNGFTSSAQNPVITNVTTAASGTYSVAVTVAGCTSIFATTAVTINPTPATPVTSSNCPICAGDTLNLNATSTAGSSYSWAGPNSFSSALQNPSIANASATASGTYSVTATVGGCNSLTGTISVTVNPIPATPAASSNGPVCEGSTLNLSASTIAGATYSWSGPNSFSSTSQNPSIVNATVAASGTYSVTATIAGCTSPAGIVVVNVNPIPPTPSVMSNSPLCAGNTLNLTAGNIPGAAYSWNGPNSFSSSVQNPSVSNVTVAASGTYAVTAIVSGCTSPAGTVTVTVNPIPPGPVASSNCPICEGSTLNLTASNVPGAVYSWTGPNSFSSALQNPSIANATIAEAGTYTVTATVSGCSGPAGTIGVIINPIPPVPPTASNSPVCQGSTLNLTAGTIAGATYSWSGPNSFSSTSQNPSIVNAPVAASGTYSVTATVSGCTSPAGTVVVNVNPIPPSPAASANSPICEGSTLNFTASTIAGATYSWNGPNSFSSATQNPSITNVSIAANGTYSVTVTVAGCTSPATTVTVTVNPIPATPVAGVNSPICSGSTLNLTASTIAGATYSWNGPNSFSSATQNPSIANATVAASGTYSVTATVAGCTSPAAIVSAVINPTPATPSVTSNSPVCSGMTLTLTSTLVVGATYSWTGPNGFASAVQNPNIANITLAAAGTYTLVVNNGCPSAPATINVVVNATPAAPTVSSNSPVCESDSLHLFAGNLPGVIYSWSGPNGFTSASQNPSIANATIAASGTYSVTATSNAGCTGTAGTTSVIINLVPAAPSPSSNSPVCTGNALNLTANFVTGATYSWTGPNSFSSTLQNPVISNVTLAANGTYSLTVTVSGCTSGVGTTTVIVNATPSTAIVSSNSPLCDGSTLNLTANFIAGATYSWTGPNGFTDSSQNPVIPNASPAVSGSYSVSITVNGCTGATGTTSVFVYPIPTAPSASVNNPICAGQTLNFTTNPVAGASYSWSGPNGFSSSLQNPSITNTNSAASGTYSVTITVNGCTSQPGTTSAVIDNPALINAGPDQTVCANNAVVTLNASSSTGGGIWTTSGTGNYLPSNTALNVSYNPSAADTASGTVTLTFTSSNNGACASVSDQVIVTITNAPTVDAGADDTVCANNAIVSLNGAFTVSSGAVWSTTGSGIFSPSANSMTADYIPGAADTAAGSVTLYLTTTGNGTCLPVSDSMVIYFTPAPLMYAGNDTILCINNPNVPLSGASNLGAGIWSTSGTGTFVNSNSLNTTYVPSPADLSVGSVMLFLSTSDKTCMYVPDTLVVIFSPLPLVNAGNDVTVCANNAVAPLNGFSSTGNATWTSSGSGIFSPDAFTLNATYVASASDTAAGAVTLTLTTTNNGGCSAASDQVVITISNAPTANTGTTSLMLTCANNPFQLNGTITGGSGTGIWTTPNGSGTFNPANTVLNAIYIPTNADTAAGIVLLILTSTNNGACFASSDTTFLIVNAGPVVSAGPDAVVCSNNPDVMLNGSVSVAQGGIWTTSGNGTFTPDSITLNATYMADSTDISAGVVTLFLTSTGNGFCSAVTDSMLVYFTPSPVAYAGASQIICSATDSVFLNGIISGSTSTGQWSTSGDGTFSPDDSTLNAVYIPGVADSATGFITLYLMSTNNGSCLAETDSLNITLTAVSTADAGNDTIVCAGNSPITLNGQITGGPNAGYWSTSGSGIFSPDSTALNASYIPGGADISAGNVMLILSPSNSCIASTDTVVITFAPAPVISAGNDAVICAGDPVPLNGSVANASGIQWSTGGNGTFAPSASITNAVYIPGAADISSGSVTLYITSSGNSFCGAATDSVVITINSKPNALFAYSPACVNAPASCLDLSTNTNGSIVSWNWNAGTNTSVLQNPAFIFTSTGTQAVTLIVATATGCADTITRTMYVNPLPQAHFTSDINCPTDAALADSSFISSGTIVSWNWDFGDSATSSLQNPLYTYSATGMYVITLTLRSDSGCISSCSDTLVFSPCEEDVDPLAVPSAFSPNGDGINDVLYVKGGPFTDLYFDIYNEWGNLIFHSTSQSVGWDGTYKSKTQPQGTYVWTVSCITADGASHKGAGHITIIR